MLAVDGAGERGDGDAVSRHVFDLRAIASGTRAEYAQLQHVTSYGHRRLRPRC